MKHPMCRLCNHEHALTAKHIWPEQQKRLPERAAEKGVEPKAVARIGREPAAVSVGVPVKSGPHVAPEDAVAELARRRALKAAAQARWRAAKKSKEGLPK